MEFLESVKKRRTYYSISDKCTISSEKLKELVQDAVKHTPSAYNSQVQRVAVLGKENHDKLWDITKEILRELGGNSNFKATEDKINSFKAGCGTILYFNDSNVTKMMQEKFSLYADKFPVFAQHANGMLQFAIWNLLEINGMGASLQHYNPLIDEKIKKEFGIDENWELLAQMPFGKPVVQPDEKTFEPLEKRIKFL